MSDGIAGAGRTLTRNAIWNAIGLAAPIPAALIAIPALITGLGLERFGFLTIAWTLLGYFSLFDFGFARATTKFLAERAYPDQPETTRRLFWTSFSTHTVLGLVGGGVLALVTPWVEGALEVSAEFRPEVTTSLYILAASVPVIVVTAFARGVLEGLQRFDLVNMVKLPASLITYLGPLLALAFTRQLPPVILLISACRVAVLVSYLIMCFRLLPPIWRPMLPSLAVLRPLGALGGWMTATSLLTPGLASVDRFVIGSVVSVAAVTAYSAPYEVVTKLWLLSSALLGVMFPAFSKFSADSGRLEGLYWRSVVILLAIAPPATGLVVAFAPEFFRLWLGPSVPSEAGSVAQWLAVGVLVNVLAQVPLTILQATGHADVTGKLQILQIPIYVIAVWFAAAHWGVVGVAMVWTMRAMVDAALMFGAAGRRLRLRGRPWHFQGLWRVVICDLLLLVWCWQGVRMFTPPPAVKAVVVCGSLVVFVWATWRQIAHLVVSNEVTAR